MDRSREMIENLRMENKEAIKSKKVLSDQMKAELQRQRTAIREEIEGVADILVQAREKRLSVIRENQVREQVVELVKQRKEALRAAELARHEELSRQREFADQQRALQEVQEQRQLQLQLQEDERQQRLFRARSEQVRREREENLSAFLRRQQEAQLQQQQQQQQQQQDQRLRRARAEMQRSHAQLVEHELQRQTLLQAQESQSSLSPTVPEAPPSRQVIAWYQRFTDNFRVRQLQDRALRLKGAVFDA